MTGLQITPPLPAHVIVPNVRIKITEKPEFSRNSRPMGREGTCMDYKTHWVSNSRKPKKYPAEEGTRGMPFLYGSAHFWSYLYPYFLETRVFWHSGVSGLRVPPFYCKTHKVASSRKSALGDDRFLAEEGTRTLLFYMEVCICGHFRNIFLGLSR